MSVWSNTDRSWRVGCRPLSFSTPLSFRRSMLWCSGLPMFLKFLKPLSASALPSCRPDVMSAVLASQSARPFPLTPVCPGKQIHRGLCSRRLHGCEPVGAAHSRLHLLQQVHWVCENDGTCNLYGTLGGQLLYCASDCLCLPGQTGGRNCGLHYLCVPSFHPAWLSPPTRPVPCCSAVSADHDAMWLAVDVAQHLYFCIGFSSWPFSTVVA